MSKPITQEKQCNYCGEVKPLEQFYNQAITKDGKRTFCKVCSNKKSKAYDQIYRKKPPRKPIAFKDTKSGRYNFKYPEKKRAVDKVFYALKTGKMSRLPCKVCFSPDVQAHHNWGYEGENALKVMWLCDPHHKEQHKKM